MKIKNWQVKICTINRLVYYTHRISPFLISIYSHDLENFFTVKKFLLNEEFNQTSDEYLADADKTEFSS